VHRYFNNAANEEILVVNDGGVRSEFNATGLFLLRHTEVIIRILQSNVRKVIMRFTAS
jgi:hypothetical protein